MSDWLNNMAYWRLECVRQMKAWPEQTNWRLTEYGFKRLNAMRKSYGYAQMNATAERIVARQRSDEAQARMEGMAARLVCLVDRMRLQA